MTIITALGDQWPVAHHVGVSVRVHLAALLRDALPGDEQLPARVGKVCVEGQQWRPADLRVVTSLPAWHSHRTVC